MDDETDEEKKRWKEKPIRNKEEARQTDNEEIRLQCNHQHLKFWMTF